MRASRSRLLSCRTVQRLTSLALIGGLASAAWADAPAAPAAAPVAGAPAGQPAGPAPKIKFAEPAFTFPEAWSGDKVEHTFIVKNEGEGVLEIREVKPGCGCTLAGDFDKKIEPGKEGKIPVALNTHGLRGDVVKQITVTSNDPVQPQTILTLKGKVKSVVDVDPVQGWAWGQITPTSKDSMTITLSNNTTDAWKLEVQNDPNQPQQQAFEITIKETEPGKKAEATATLKKPLKEGSTFAQFKLKTGIERQPEVMVAANYYNPPALQVMPSVVYGNVPPGQAFPTMLTVVYNREGDLKIESAAASDPAIKTEVSQPNPQDNKRYSVRVVIPADWQAAPDKPAQVEIKTDKTDLPNNGVVIVPIRVQRAQTPPPPQLTAPQMQGRVLPAIALKDPEGKPVAASMPNTITLVNNWASWCGFCKKQIPVLEKLRQTYEGKGVRFLNVSGDAPRPVPQTDPNTAPQMETQAQVIKKVLDTSAQMESKLPIAFDVNHEAASKWGAGSFPTLFVVDKRGIVAAVHVGAQANLEETLKSELDLLLAGKPIPAAVVATATQPAMPAQPQQPTIQGPALVIDTPRQDVGQRKPGEVAQFAISLRNGGTQIVEVKNIKPASEAVKVDPSFPNNLNPGQTSMLRLEIAVPRKPGQFSETLAIQSNDPSKPDQTVTLVGTVRPYVEVQPATGVTFPRNPRTQSVPSLATLVYNGEGTIEYGKPECSSPKFEATIEPIPNGPYAKLIVKTKPPFETGENNATIHITTNSKDQPELEVPVKLYVPPRIEITPAELTLSPTGRVQRQMVTIRNNGEKSLSILGVKSTNEKIVWQFYPNADGLSYQLMVTVPGSEGNTAATVEKITVRTDDPEYGEIVVPIKFTAAAQGNAALPTPVAR